LRFLHSWQARVIFGRTSLLATGVPFLAYELEVVRVVAEAGLEPATQRL
jgi:hypothetical protein